MEAIRSAKSALRKEVKEIINKISKEERKRQSDAICNKILILPKFQSSQRVSIYLSTEDEINTLPILTQLFKSGKQVFVPKYKGKVMQMVKLYSLEDYHNLPLTKWMIKQPNDEREDALQTGGLDLIILPGVAFTLTGKRLGHGMGYYDKFLNNCIETMKSKPYLVAVAFKEQIFDDIPTTETDVILDKIVTEKNE